jgi:hypothetical protein
MGRQCLQLSALVYQHSVFNTNCLLMLVYKYVGLDVKLQRVSAIYGHHHVAEPNPGLQEVTYPECRLH